MAAAGFFLAQRQGVSIPSHVSLLINMGFSALDIAERVGHEAIDITYRYAHLFPAKRAQIADALSELRGE